jgi:hypothetical protein
MINKIIFISYMTMVLIIFITMHSFCNKLEEYLKNIDYHSKKAYQNGETIKKMIQSEDFCIVVYKENKPVKVNANCKDIKIINEHILKVR